MQEGALEVVRAQGGGRFRWKGYELSSLFQPIHCVERGHAIGHEALVRAAAPDGDPPGPGELFADMEATERTRFDWISRALHLRTYAQQDTGDRTLFLKVHPGTLGEGAADFAQLARFYGLSPARICIEVREHESGDEARLAESVAAHRRLGFSIAIDHFGQGRSNFDRLTILRPRLVKVDRALLEQAVGASRGARVLPSLVAMLAHAGAHSVVKGVDNATHALEAIEAGAGYLQGLHVGAPTRSSRDEALTRELILSARRLTTA
jgi:EAL domain-containing protein (putative c-di-GMP-specific phosphodiesterase class I)